MKSADRLLFKTVDEIGILKVPGNSKGEVMIATKPMYFPEYPLSVIEYYMYIPSNDIYVPFAVCSEDMAGGEVIEVLRSNIKDMLVNSGTSFKLPVMVSNILGVKLWLTELGALQEIAADNGREDAFVSEVVISVIKSGIGPFSRL